ncbi:acyl-CoA dehydrogenase family protein [Streptomyces virginiae]|uniref:acyl-CoA dehydrogenase family protein n=1 Tax=Streptomyces TaxID=1883 RepID=UPI0006B06886|nr:MULTISPECIES: acyl-CoA dehydrogenase family protein [unclassified Streptomyces]KOU60057.1 hydrolase [Streptomyces sp. IGB124]KOU96234.1 hydrolase [Streptomyces sp. XY58]KOV11804.1 hydrolase [Streptomyces sp. XY37]KOV14269.1 hydrolase [Streptomyces sp. XY413]KOV54995.1 hydrolase [Streptomyces sp. MMG1064]
MPQQTQSAPEPALTAREVGALAADRAEAAEAVRSLDPDVVRALLDAGFARHFVPVAHGGHGGGFGALTDAVTTIGASCPATAWCASIALSLSRMAGFLPEEGRKRIWQDGPDVLVVGSVSPRGRALPADGGWRLTGTWPYVSAVEHSDWALVLGLAKTPDAASERRIFAIPRSAYAIDRTWSDIGMRASGSHTLTVDDLHVPAEMSFPVDDLMTGRPSADGSASGGAGGGGAVAAAPGVPLAAVNGLFFCLPMLGAAEGALAHWSAYAQDRLRAERPGVPGPGRSFYEETLARAGGEIDAARLLLERISAVADSGREITALETARAQRDCALVADLLVGAVDRLFRASGTAGHSESSPLQRLWRDVHSAAGHIVLQFGPNASAYAAQALPVGPSDR